MASQRNDVFLAVAERGQRDLHFVEPEKQVAAEGAALDRIPQLPVRGRQHAHVGALHLSLTQPQELAALEEAQQCDLNIRGQVAYFVEEERSAIRRVHEGNIYLSPGVSGALVDALLSKSGQPFEPLSPRERQVLQLVGEGKSTKEIAELLFISAKTVESHRARLMQKLDIHDVARLVRYAIRRGLVEA